MATVSKWTPFGVALDITATGGTVTRTSATQFKVNITVSWETYYSGAQTNYGMTAASGGVTHTISAFNGTKRSSGSGSFTGTYSISGNGAATKTITVTFRNFNDLGDSATKNVTFNVNVPAWTSYTITYNANGGTGAPSAQTKWRDQALTLSSTKPTRTGYSFLGWSTSSTATTATYSSGGTYPASSNSAATLYAVWKANTYSVKYNANGGTGAPGNQTKTYGQTLKLSTTKPTRTNYNFKGWGTSASATTVAYTSGANYTANAAITLYAVWELAYVKPIISDFTVNRCTSNGTASDEGTYASVNFSFECTYTVSSIKIEWKASNASSWSSTTVSATGTSGSIDTVVGGGGISVERAYRVRVTVSDSNGSTTVTKIISGMSFPIDIVPGEVGGISFGKTADEEGVADFGYKMKSSNGELVSSPMEVPEGTHLDDLEDPGHYIIGNTALSSTIVGKPLWYSGTNGTARIEVLRYGDGAQIVQKYYPCTKDEQFEISRMRYSGTWSDWMITGGCSPWADLTVASGFEVYGSGTKPQYRVNGNMVTVTGAVKPTATVTSNTTGVMFASGIKTQYCPKNTLAFVCQGSGINRWLLQLNQEGKLYVARYGTNDYVDITAGAWLIFTVTYSI